MAVQDGNTQKGSFLAGEISGIIKKRQPVKKIIEEIMNEAAECLKMAEMLVV